MLPQAADRRITSLPMWASLNLNMTSRKLSIDELISDATLDS